MTRMFSRFVLSRFSSKKTRFPGWVDLAGSLAVVPRLSSLRFAYCALSSLTILDALDQIDVDACVDWILP